MEKMNPVKLLFPHLPERLAGLEELVEIFGGTGIRAKLDTNWLGIPTEGYGFLNDAKAMLGPPSFPATSFPYDGQDMELTISLHY